MRSVRKRMRWSAVAPGLSLGVVLVGASRARADLAEAWGLNYSGQLGDGSNNDSNTPVAVTGMSSGVTAVAAGLGHSLAIQDGAVHAWGDNEFGELGNGSTVDSYTPVAVTGLPSGVTAVTAGAYHSLAIVNGAAYSWGRNNEGELGNNSTTNSSTPVAVTGLTSGVTAVAAGGFYSLAVQDGSLLGWGDNDHAQSGGPRYSRPTTPQVILKGGVTAIAAGEYHSLAVQNGVLRAWGYNAYGQLGNGTTTDVEVADSSQAIVVGMNSGVTSIAEGVFHSLAVKNGNVYAWGDDNDGQVGDGAAGNSSTPVLVLDTAADLVAVAAGDFSSYALSSDGSLWVWGSNAYGQLGLGTTTADYTTPQHLLPPSGYVFTSIDANALGDHAVATLAAVPEPTTLGMLAASSLLLLRRRSR